MESPLLKKSEQNLDVTITGDASSNNEHLVNIISEENFSSNVAEIPYIVALGLILIEFVVTLVKIVVAIVIVTGTKGDHQETTWINAYTCGCILILPILCWRLWNYPNATSETRFNAVMIVLKTLLDYFFAGWSIVFLWVFVSNPTSLEHTAPLFWLCVVFLAFGFIRYVLPLIICAAMCCCVSVTLCFETQKRASRLHRELILDGGSEILKQGFGTSVLVSKDRILGVSMKRRPGLDYSNVDADKDLDNFLSKLLASYELDRSVGVKLFEEPLHINPIDKHMLSLPEFPNVRRMGLKACGKKTSNQRSAWSYVENLLKGVNNNAIRKNRQLSPNPPEDQFTFHDRDFLLRGDKQSRKVDQVKDLNVCFRSSVANNSDNVITNASLSNVGTVHAGSPFNGSVQKSSYEDSGVHVSHSRPDGNADNCVDDSITKGNSATLEVNVDMRTEGNEQEDHIYSDKQTSKRRKRRSCYSNMKQRSKTMPDESQGDKQMRTLSHENEANKQTNRKSKDGEEKKQKKTVTHEGTRRKSLAAAGTKCESGVRRSTRIKSKPLEYWRGERFLFGRIHENLTTLIGVKYASPPDKGDKEKRVLKVKSFVSDDYKELVDLAAMN
ncbi:unnamed protein product [Cochlearia groenlandica]